MFELPKELIEFGVRELSEEEYAEMLREDSEDLEDDEE